MTIITVISQQPLTTEQVNSFKSVPAGGLDGQVLTKASNNNFDVVWEDAGGSSSTTNLSIANKTTTTFDILSSTGTDATLPSATITEAGLLIATDKVKLNNLGTASYLNVPASGNAASGEVVKGNDTRLSDARTPLSHSHVISDVTGLQTVLDGKFNNPIGDTTQYIAGDGSLIAFPVAGQAGTLVRQVRNETGSTLTKGTVIYLSGASGNKPLALRAIANSEAASDRTFGIVQADISNNSNGYAVVSGDLVGVDTSSLTEGSIVYLSGTVAGGVTTTQPVSPLHSVVLGVVTRSHVTQGQFDVSIQNGFEIEDLHDVLITTKTNKDVLRYESSTGLWKNVQLATSDVTGLDTALSGKQPLDGDLTAIAALAGTTGFLKKTAVDTWTLDTSTYLTGNQSITVSGDASGSGTTAITLTLPNIATAGTYKSVTINAKGQVTGGTNPTTLSGYGITDAQGLNATLTSLSGLSTVTTGNVKLTNGVASLDTNTYYLASNPNGYTTNTGTVTTASVVSANGFAGTVATAGTTPAITLSTTITGLLKGNGTAISAATAGTDYLTPTGSAASLTGLTSTQVTTALGFTPYNATNPSGYTSNVGTVTTFSFTNGGGFTGTVSTAGTTPALSLTLQNATTAQSGQLTSTDWNTFNGKQAALVSGTNIRTVNGNTLLGSTDLVVQSNLGAAYSSTSVTITNSNGSGIAVNAATTSLAGFLTATDKTKLDGLAIGSTVQAWDADLDAVAALSTNGFAKRTGAGTWAIDGNTYLTGNQTITVTGDVSGSGATAITLNLGSNVVTNAKLAQVATATFKGRITASTGNVEDLTATQATSLLDVFTTSSKGLVGASGGGTTNFLRADGTWAAPAGGGGGSGNAVVVDVDFGSTFTDKAQVVVTGQSWVATTSSITCQVLCPSVSDPDELYLLNIKPVVSSLVNGTGFTLTLYSEQEAKGIYKVMCVGV